MKTIYFLAVFIIFAAFANAQSHSAQIISIPAPALEGNLLGDSTIQNIEVYLPSSYNQSTKVYPVIYYLHGYNSGIKLDFFTPMLNKFYETGRNEEVILVAVSGKNKLRGSFYVNSPITGNWEDYIVKDLVNFIDSNYRTLTSPDSRAITGHSMGGFGCLYIAMRNTNIFGLAYALSPGLFDIDGLKNSQMFKDSTTIQKHLDYLSKIAKLDGIGAHKELLKKAEIRDDKALVFMLAYGAAFASNTYQKAPYFNYPINTNLKTDTTIWDQWENGFGYIKNSILKNSQELKELNYLAIDCGYSDNYKWIIEGSIYLSAELSKNNIPHSLIMHNGSHSSKRKKQIINSMLPNLISILKYE